MTVCCCWGRDTLSRAKVKYAVGFGCCVIKKTRWYRFKDVLSSACAEDASKLKSKSAGLTFDSQTGTPTFLLYCFIRYVSFFFWILKLCFGIWTMIVPVLTPLQEVTLMSWVLINDKFF